MFKKLFLGLSFILCASAVFAQAPAQPAINVATFTLNASPISLPGIGTTVAGSDSGFKFQATMNFALREDNITASGFQFYGGGFNYALAALSNKLNNISPNLNGLQFSFYITGSAGVDRITSLPTAAQHYAFMGGGGFLYRLSTTSAWATGIEVKYAKFPGYNNNTFVVSVPIAFSF